MTTNYRHIRFEKHFEWWVCLSTHGRAGIVLGRLEWLARWREWEYIPETNTGYTIGCLRDIAAFIAQLPKDQNEVNA